jgi:hypothetical protein
MWQTNNGHTYCLSLHPDMRKMEVLPIGLRNLTAKPCSDCGNAGCDTLFKGRDADWLCRCCAKSQNII